MSGCPHVCTPPYVCMLHMCIYPRGVHPPYAPYSSVHLFLEALHIVGGCNGLPFVLGHLPYTTSVWGCLPFNYTPTLSCWFLVHWYVSGISVCYVDISLLLKALGVIPHQLEGLGASALEMSVCSFLYLFCSALCLMLQLQLRLLLLQLQWYLLACHQCHQ